MPDFCYPREYRLRNSREFDRVFAQQQKASDRFLLVFVADNDLGWTRLGLSVSKKHGNAIRRARLKRLLREAFRLKQHQLPRGWDLIVIPRQNSGGTLEDYRRSLMRLTHKLAKRFTTPARDESPS